MARKWIGPLWHNFRGRKYKIRHVPRLSASGSCDDPATEGKEILIGAQHNKDPYEELDTIMHEATHACLWDLSEDAVDEIARSLSKFLWRIGYRR